MIRLTQCVASAALALGLSAGGATAQTALTIGTGAGVSVPIGDLGDFYGIGWNAQANVGVHNTMWPVGLRFDVAYNSLPGDAIEGEDGDIPGLNIISGLANVELYVARAAAGGGLFLVGGAGIHNIDSDFEGAEGVTKFGLLGGAGYKLAMTNLFLGIEGKFHHIFTDSDESGDQPGVLSGSAQFIPVTVFVEIPLGGR